MNFALPVTSSVGSWPVGMMPISGPLIGQPWAKSSVAPEAVGGAEELTDQGGPGSSVTGTSSFRVCFTVMYVALPNLPFLSQTSFWMGKDCNCHQYKFLYNRRGNRRVMGAGVRWRGTESWEKRCTGRVVRPLW